jgi:hypothetical protein
MGVICHSYLLEARYRYSSLRTGIVEAGVCSSAKRFIQLLMPFLPPLVWLDTGTVAYVLIVEAGVCSSAKRFIQLLMPFLPPLVYCIGTIGRYGGSESSSPPE